MVFISSISKGIDVQLSLSILILAQLYRAGITEIPVAKLLKATGDQNTLLLLSILLMVSGVHLVTTDFLAEILMVTYCESRNIRPYTSLCTVEKKPLLSSLL